MSLADTRRGVERGVESISTPPRRSFDIRFSIEKPRPSIEEGIRSRPSTDIQRGLAELTIRENNKIEKHENQKKKKKTGGMEDLKSELVLTEHLESILELSKKHTESNIDPNDVESSKGLSSTAAHQRYQLNGPNRLKPPKETSQFIVFFRNFTNFFALLMEGAAVLCLIAFFISLGQSLNAKTEIIYDNLYIAVVLIFIVVANALFTYFQERSSSNVAKEFAKMAPTDNIIVIRDGKELGVKPDQLVIGDLVKIKLGDRIPADIRILHCADFTVDNSSLTGEVEPQARSPNNTSKNPLETKNLAFFGTSAMQGSCLGLVIQTGDGTAIGRIAQLVGQTKPGKTPLRIEIDSFCHIITAVAVVEGLFFLVLGFILNSKPDFAINNIITAIGIIVANVPEALLPTVTASLTLTAKRMKDKNVMVKNLEAVETLGSCTTVCSDKTGTLTQNRMTVAHVWYDGGIRLCNTSVNDKKADFSLDAPTFQKLQRCATLCSSAKFVEDPINLEKHVLKRATIGDASESALIKFVHPLRDIYEYRTEMPLIYTIPFNSKNKWQLNVCQSEDKSKTVVMMKGAPEMVLQYCDRYMMEGNILPKDDDFEKRFNATIKTLSSYGERILGFCELDISNQPDDVIVSQINEQGLLNVKKLQPTDLNLPRKQMCFIGLTALIDPPKEGVPEAVSLCNEAGIRVVMVTGDHPDTAKAIARQVNIIKGDTVEDIMERENIPRDQVPEERVDAVVVAGTDISVLTEKDWRSILKKRQIVFARTSPQQKLVIVERFQNNGEFVAVTGDGVNDSPALKKADIGIAMNISGSQVSKDSADMILLDDNFASIVSGIEQGRLIFDNLKKSIAYTVTHNVAELTPVLISFISGIPLPLGTLLMLSVDLGLDMIPAILYAYEPSESDIMKRPPRKRTDRLVTLNLLLYCYLQAGVVVSCGGFFAYLLVYARNGFEPSSLPLLYFNGYFQRGAAPLTNSVGSVLNEGDQLYLLHLGWSAFYAAILVGQWGNLLSCKTRNLSLFQHGIGTYWTVFAMVVQLIVACGIIYIPGLNMVFSAVQLPFLYWLAAVPFSFFLFGYNEMRKMMFRGMGKNNWIDKHVMW
ncbi:sodium/potassium-transporting ATPase subunit alpha [Acrasis kona]|uniref:Sodium/potassium-transporting ATPase subunit alpha n=1 Tax=Acrasis kona TaxID=1008807 RepID=A0AAW2ZJS9_9EUKA